MKLFLKFVSSILPISPVYAHCDVPCGIYDPKTAQIAAATVLKMTQKIVEEKVPDAENKEEMVRYQNAMIRYVFTKEEHARKCKEEILILWTDYFKPEHLKKFPTLHETFWKAAKLCSSAKQEVSEIHAKELVVAVDEIASLFAQSKQS
jgi:nickel superoxide dismutase